MKAFFFAGALCLLLASCRTTRLGKNALVYQIDKNNKLQAYTVSSKYNEDLTPNADNIIILDNSDPSLFTPIGAPVQITPNSTIGTDVLDNFFFADVSGLVKKAKKNSFQRRGIPGFQGKG